MIELRELGTARAIFKTDSSYERLEAGTAGEILRQEDLLFRTFFILTMLAYQESTKEKRRAQIAQALAAEVNVVPPSRLMTLIGQALKWQQHQGSHSLAFSCDGSQLLTASVDNTARDPWPKNPASG
uniref:Uncharacterized protein n=1 Tax=Salix viminalis TaxID=40686 RepID=A0A6N2NIW6_SALVM